MGARSHTALVAVVRGKTHWRPAWRGGVLCNKWDCTLHLKRNVTAVKKNVTCKKCRALLVIL